MFSHLKSLIKEITPFGIIKWRGRMKARLQNEEKIAYHEARKKKAAAVLNLDPRTNDYVSGEDWHAVTDHLIRSGLDPFHVIEGSIPADSLELVVKSIESRASPERPIYGLHIGNFVGVSLAYLTAASKRINANSLIVAIDPNLTHRGVKQPQDHVSRLLWACNLQANVLMVTGYSGKKSISNDGVVYANYDPESEFSTELACEDAVKSVCKLATGKLDFVLMDGNHEASYLIKEIEEVLPLLKSGGLVILDDVDTAWEEIRAVFNKIEDYGLTPIASNGRIGIASLDTLSRHR